VTTRLVRRLALALAVLWAVVTLTFVAVHLAPGDPFLPGSERPADPAVVANLKVQFGLDRPLSEQYLRYLGQVVRGNFGVSFLQRRPVAEAIAATLPHTLLLAAAALTVDFLLGLTLGLVQAARAGGRLDVAATNLALLIGSLPTFWVGLVLILVFGEWLRWLPLGGAYDPAAYGALDPAGRVVHRLQYLVLPALTLGLVGAASTARYQRAAVLEVLGQDFVRAARAKGLSERRVLVRHVLRNALAPAVTLFGLAAPFVLTGAVLVESVFGWPGMGRLAATAVAGRDYPMVTAAALITAILVVAGNLLADALVAALDPRVRRGG
jgi:peptide/nickel transport system permease protein